MLAVLNGQVEIAKALIGAGADKARDAQGKTTLMQAVEMTAASGNDGERALMALEALLGAGADTQIVDNEGKTARMHAEELAAIGNDKALRVFIKADNPTRSGS